MNENEELAEVGVKSYMRNGRVVRSYRRRGKPGRGTAAAVGDMVKDATKGAAKVGTERHTTTYGTVSMNGDYPTVSVAGIAMGKDEFGPLDKQSGLTSFVSTGKDGRVRRISVNASGVLGKIPKSKLRKLERAIADAIDEWSMSKDAWSSVYKYGKNGNLDDFDPFRAMDKKTFEEHVRPVIDKAVDRWAKENGGELSGRIYGAAGARPTTADDRRRSKKRPRRGPIGSGISGGKK